MQTQEIFDERYRIIQRLGAGSEGEVFLALYVPTEEFRAVKKIRTGENESFCRELEMMKGLRGDHLPRVIDVLFREDCTYLVMEHIRGISMDQILAGGKNVTQAQTLEAALQLTDALCYLEQRDPPVCHLDIKPSNLIRRPDGTIVLVDFGAAWKEKTCRPGKGTDGYAAPEQYDPGGVTDVRTDLYGLGAVLYRMLSGKTWSKTLYGSRVPNCSEEFGRIVSRCLEPGRDRRYGSASELRRDLALLRRRENFRHIRIRILGALAIAFPAAAFGTSVLPASMNLSARLEWDYESLLKEAQICGEEEARSCYRRAIFLDPGRSDAYLHFLEDAGSDGQLTAEEDVFLRELLHMVVLGTDRTCEEVLAEDIREYGQTALKIALLYWYCSEGEDGRRIASGWFSRAAGAGEGLSFREQSSCLWYRTACLYRDMASARKLVQSRAGGAADPETIRRYWDLQTELALATQNLESPRMRLEWVRDTLTDLSFLSADLERAGISISEQRQRVRELMDAAKAITGLPGVKMELSELEEEAGNSASLALETLQNREREDGRNRDE